MKFEQSCKSDDQYDSLCNERRIRLDTTIEQGETERYGVVGYLLDKKFSNPCETTTSGKHNFSYNVAQQVEQLTGNQCVTSSILVIIEYTI